MARVVASSRTHKALKRVLRRPVGVFSAHFAVIPTDWGVCGAVWKNQEQDAAVFAQGPAGVLCRIYTPGRTEAELRKDVMRRYPGCNEVLADAHGRVHPSVVPEWFAELVRFLQGYYTSSPRHENEPECVDHWALWSPRLDWSQLTPFQRRVVNVVGQIPSGRKLTYGEVAGRVGNPAASRAVGATMAANPWPVLVPCHRVVGASGKMTGFSAPGGVETKRRMLAMEAR